MTVQQNSGRRDTGRTDKYSDETPKKDYADYRKDYPLANETARKESEEISNRKVKPHFIGKKSFEVRKQELTSHLQNYQETFSNAEKKIWKSKYEELLRALGV